MNARIKAVTACLLVGWFWAGCTVGPGYQRPSVSVPPAYRGLETPPLGGTSTNTDLSSVAELGWWQVFQDAQLTAYMAEALTNNWDVQAAAARVLAAEAEARVVRSRFFPTVSAGGDLVTSRASQRGAGTIPAGVDPQREFGDAFLAMPAYEVDLWGKIRRSSEAARARLLASVETERIVRQTLVTQVATAYLDLLELDLELAIAQRTHAVRTNSLELTRTREQGGVASLQDVDQARILVSTAEASMVDTRRRVEQGENLISLLLGRDPGPVARGGGLATFGFRTEVPAGLPSRLLEQRPDLRAAEKHLVAANADVGQAKAAFYPQLTLTGSLGYQSVALSDLFTGGSRTWQFGPSVAVPLFTGGRLRGGLKAAEARFQEAVATYRKSVQSAFREVSDALVAYQRTREFRGRQEERTQAHREASELAAIRYQGGVTSYLEVLYNEQELFGAELGLAQARRNELLSVVQLYRALGGGWTLPSDRSE